MVNTAKGPRVQSLVREVKKRKKSTLPGCVSKFL